MLLFSRGFSKVFLVHNSMFNSYGALLFGATLAMMALLPLQAVTNATAVKQCTNETDTHTLVTVRAFAGTAKYCVDNRYL